MKKMIFIFALLSAVASVGHSRVGYSDKTTLQDKDFYVEDNLHAPESPESLPLKAVTIKIKGRKFRFAHINFFIGPELSKKICRQDLCPSSAMRMGSDLYLVTWLNSEDQKRLKTGFTYNLKIATIRGDGQLDFVRPQTMKVHNPKANSKLFCMSIPTIGSNCDGFSGAVYVTFE